MKLKTEKIVKEKSRKSNAASVLGRINKADKLKTVYLRTEKRKFNLPISGTTTTKRIASQSSQILKG